MSLVDGHRVPYEDVQGTASQPTLVAHRHRSDRRSAAPCRAAVGTGNTVGGEADRSDLSRLLLMDLWVVRSQTCCFARGDRWSSHQTKALTDLLLAPYLEHSVLDRVAEDNSDAEYTLVMNSSAQKTDGCRTQSSESRRTMSSRIEDLVLANTEQMLELQKNLQTGVRRRRGRASSNLTAEILPAYPS